MGAERSPFLPAEGRSRRRRLARRARKRAPSATLAASGSAGWSLRIDHRRSAQARGRLRRPTVALLALIVPVAILAALLLALWLALQVLEAEVSGTGSGGGVANFAHIGGFLFGLALIRAFLPGRSRLRPRTPALPSP